MLIEKISHPTLNLKGFRIKMVFDSKPVYRFLNALEQCVEKYNTNYLYLVFHCKGKENVGFRVRKCKILEELTIENYNEITKMYQIEFYKIDNFNDL